MQSEDLSRYYKILGVHELSGLKEIRAAYCSKARLYHPDLPENRNTLNNHLRMIQLNLAYNTFKSQFRNSLESTQPMHTTKAPPREPVHYQQSEQKEGLTLYKDPAYSYYKRGHRYYTQINPSRWVYLQEKESQDVGPSDHLMDEVLRRIKETIDFFPKAYYNFSIVASEYPGSLWYDDAKAKMRKIEKLTPIYMKILESYREEYS